MICRKRQNKKDNTVRGRKTRIKYFNLIKDGDFLNVFLVICNNYFNIRHILSEI